MADYVTVDFLSETKAKVTIRGRSSTSSAYWMIFKPAHVWSESDTSTYVRISHKNFKSVTIDGPITKLAPKINTTGEAEIIFPVVAGSAIESICFMDVTNGSDSRFTSWRDLCKRAYTDGAQYLSEADDLYDSIATDYLLFERLSPLATPTGLKVTNDAVITTTAKQTVTWNTVANATGYKLEYKQSSSTTWNSVTRTDATVIFPNRTRDVSYDHRVTALGDGTTYKDSDASSVVTKKTKQQLATPTGLTCTNKTATSLTFSWNEVSGTKTYNLGYKLPSASSYTYLTPTSSPATITGLTAGTTYQVYISARTPTDSTNYDGSAYTSPVSIATLAPLSTPTGLNADQITSNSATISWNAVENASDYKVEYRRQGDTTWNE